MTGSLLRATVKRFHEIGTVNDRARSGRKRTVRIGTAIERVRKSVTRDPMLSTRKRARLLGISRTSLMRIQRLDLHAKPYKLQLVQQLYPADTIQRRIFCEKFLQLVAAEMATLSNDEPSIAHRLIMGDETHFELSSAVFNRQNVRFWGTENPRLWRPRTLHSARVTVWCGVSSAGILGPYFFETSTGAAQSVTGERYRRMLTEYIEPLLRTDRRFNTINDWWWQQDGATAHTARETMAVLHRLFGTDRIISRGANFNWPVRSPDLSAPDYFLWGYLKARVYRIEQDVLSTAGRNTTGAITARPNDDSTGSAADVSSHVTPRTTDELKRAIIREIEILNTRARRAAT